MWWMALGSAIAGWIGGAGTNAEAKANTRLSFLNAEVGNKLRQASNANKAAVGNLDRWVQSLNNNRRLDSGGQALEQSVVNYRRGADADLNQSFSNSIRTAESQGASAAAAAVSGVDGDVVDMVNGSTALRDSIVRQQVEDYQDFKSYDQGRRAGNIFSQMVGGLNSSLILETMDYNIDVGKETPTISALARAIRGAAPMVGSLSTGTDKTETAVKPEYTQEDYDKSDAKFANYKPTYDSPPDDKYKDDYNPYELWGGHSENGATSYPVNPGYTAR